MGQAQSREPVAPQLGLPQTASLAGYSMTDLPPSQYQYCVCILPQTRINHCEGLSFIVHDHLSFDVYDTIMYITLVVGCFEYSE